MSFDYLRQLYQEKMDQNFHRPGVKMIEYRHFFDNIPFLVCQKYNLRLDKNIHIRGYIIGFSANKLPRKLSAHIFSRMSSNHVGPNEEYLSIYTSNMRNVHVGAWRTSTQILDWERVGVGGLEAWHDWLPPGHKWTEVDRARNVPHCAAGYCRHRSYHCLAPSRLPSSVGRQLKRANLWIQNIVWVCASQFVQTQNWFEDITLVYCCQQIPLCCPNRKCLNKHLQSFIFSGESYPRRDISHK